MIPLSLNALTPGEQAISWLLAPTIDTVTTKRAEKPFGELSQPSPGAGPWSVHQQVPSLLAEKSGC